VKLSALNWVQLIAAALVLAMIVGTARERLRYDRHCHAVATIVVDCR
jgi:hypothetical protein